jgi:hypothetical protein
VGRSSTNYNSKDRKILKQKLRTRDGDNCCHCGELMLFDVADQNDALYATFEHDPPKRARQMLRSDPAGLKLAHRKCNK